MSRVSERPVPLHDQFQNALADSVRSLRLAKALLALHRQPNPHLSAMAQQARVLLDDIARAIDGKAVQL